jgi:hypothetical protein
MNLKTFLKKALKAVLPYGVIILYRRLKKPATVCEKAVKMNYDDNPLPSLSEEISFVIVTSGRYLDSLINLLKSVSELVDETVVILDNDDEGIRDKIKMFSDVVVMLPGKGCYEAYSRDIFRYCTKSWILRLDDDETLSANCTKDMLKRLISDRTVFAYWIPRKWFVDANSYISSSPWYPDYQLRLFRNQISCVELPQYIHSPLTVHGNTEKVEHFHLNHWDLIYKSRSEREKKVKYYDALLPGNGYGKYYLYEDEKIEITKE